MTKSPTGVATASRGLRRSPTQQRSRERVARILGAAEALVASQGLDALTVRAVALGADVPVGSIYQFFGDLDGLITALAMSFVDDASAVFDQVAGQPFEGWQDALSAMVDAYAAFFEERPALRELWLSGYVGPDVLSYEAGASDVLAERMRELLSGLAGTTLDAEITPWRLAVEVIDHGLRLAHRSSGQARIVLLRELHVLARVYVADLLGR
jgi:AcrR family transcriptional regulator